MKWQDWQTFLLSFLLPFSVGLIPIWMRLIKQLAINKKLKADINIDSFNSILEESKELRLEFKKERNFLKEELEKERSVVDKMAKTVVELTTKNEQIVFQNKILVQHLRNIIGLKSINDSMEIKIFVLEDNDDDVILMKRLFDKSRVHNVYYFKDPDELIKSIDNDTRILIIDHKLGGNVTGLEVIKKIVDANEYRYFIMLSGMADFDVIYDFNMIVLHGTYILKGRIESDNLLIKAIKNTIHYLDILSDAYKETEKTLSI